MKLNKEDFNELDKLLNKIGFGSYYDCLQLLKDAIYNLRSDLQCKLEKETDLLVLVMLVNKLSKGRNDLDQIIKERNQYIEKLTIDHEQRFRKIIEILNKIKEELSISIDSCKNSQEFAIATGDKLGVEYYRGIIDSRQGSLKIFIDWLKELEKV